MAKAFPQNILLRQETCPACGEKLRNGKLRHDGNVVRAVCRKDGCGFSVDLCWLGDIGARQN